MAKKFSIKTGFSLVETLIVVGVIAIITAGSFSLLKARRKHDLDAAKKQIVALLSEAQSRSVSQADGEAWGVYLSNGTPPFYALFKKGYATSTADRIYRLPDTVYFGATLPNGAATSVMFREVSGAASGSLSISIYMASDPNVSSSILVGPGGRVSF